MFAKSAYELHHVRLSACTITVPAGWIYVKFDMGVFDENLSRDSKFI